jgi:hypothetical protein
MRVERLLRNADTIYSTQLLFVMYDVFSPRSTPMRADVNF